MTRKIAVPLLAAALLVSASMGLLAQAKAAPKANAAAAAALDPAAVLKSVKSRSVGPTQQSGRFVDFAVGLEGLTSLKYVVFGQGEFRT